MNKNHSIELSEKDFIEEKLLIFDQLIHSAIADGLIPGLEALCFRSETVLLHRVYGNKRLKPSVEELMPHSIFDVASMTKPIVTATLMMHLVEKGMLGLGDRVTDYFSEFKGDGKEDVTLIHLLTHSSGLPAWHNLYEAMESEDEAVEKYRFPGWETIVRQAFRSRFSLRSLITKCPRSRREGEKLSLL